MKSILEVLNESNDTMYLKMLGNLDYDIECKNMLLEFCKVFKNELKIISGTVKVDGGAFHIEWLDVPKAFDMVYSFNNEQATINGESFTWKDFQKLAYGKKNWLVETAKMMRK